MPNECLQCGRCCFSRLETYVRVTGEDWARLGDAAGRLAHFVGNRAFLRMEAGHCAALIVNEDAEGAVTYFCSIYAKRPGVCRELERGSPVCEAERELKAGLTAPVTVGRREPVLSTGILPAADAANPGEARRHELTEVPGAGV